MIPVGLSEDAGQAPYPGYGLLLKSPEGVWVAVSVCITVVDAVAEGVEDGAAGTAVGYGIGGLDSASCTSLLIRTSSVTKKATETIPLTKFKTKVKAKITIVTTTRNLSDL